MNKMDETETITRTLTFDVPNVLIDYQQDNGSQPVLILRQGGSRQIEHTISIDYYDVQVDDTSKLFVIKAKNLINFGALRIEVLNDEIKGDKPIAASAPTASKYMENVGTPVLLAFYCSKVTLNDNNVYKVVRSFITLP